jgi:DNA-binding NarL/FixJ family response regulator
MMACSEPHQATRKSLAAEVYDWPLPDESIPVAVQDEVSLTARLIVADDHTLIRAGTRAMLEGEPDLEVVGEADNGRKAVELCEGLCPDLALMDVCMPEMDRLEATRRIKESCPATGVLVMTAHPSSDYLLDAVKAGAAGYILKTAPFGQLLDTIRRTIQGEFPLDQKLTMHLLRRLIAEADRQTGLASREETRRGCRSLPEMPAEPLADREIEVLGLLAQGKTNREISRELFVSLSTVKTHVHRIIAKLGVSDRTQAAVRVVELGLLSERKA